MRRYGMTIPFDGPLASQREQVRELVDLGYIDAWTSEVDGTDAFTPLAESAVEALGIAAVCE